MLAAETFVALVQFTGSLAGERQRAIRARIHQLECSDDRLYLNKSKVDQINELYVEIKRLSLLETMINKWFA